MGAKVSANNSELPAVIFLMGPTAAGKTDVAIALAENPRYEIISVDSAMIYRGMDIGTAKPEPDVLKRAPHHLINIRNPDESYSAAEFCRDANQLIDDIHARNNIPLLVGGTIMYFHALQFGINELPAADPTLREQMNQRGEAQGWPSLHRELTEVDPESAAKIHPNDAQRIQRALEVYTLTGVRLSAHHAQQQPTRQNINIINIGLFPQERSQLHAKIGERFNIMLQQGIIDEVMALKANWPLTAQMPSMRCVGYRQIWQYLNHDIAHEQMCEQVVAATRQLAKRQITWLRSYPNTLLIDPYTCNPEQIKQQIIYQLQPTNC